MYLGSAFEIEGELTVDNVIKSISEELMENGTFDFVDPDNLVEVAEDIVNNDKRIITATPSMNGEIEELTSSLDTEKGQEIVNAPIIFENLRLIDARIIIKALEKVRSKEIKKIINEISPFPVHKTIAEAVRNNLLDRINNQVVKFEVEVGRELLGDNIKINLSAM